MPERMSVEVAPDQGVPATLYPATGARLDITLILAHGAGAGQTSAFMVAFATGLADRGVDAVTFDFPYMAQGRRLPDRNDRLEACWRAVIDAVGRHDRIGRNRIVIGGKSMGGRIATQAVAAGADVAGLVLLGYPLHPPDRPEKLRAGHLARIKAPMLFVQGSRDPFGTPDELRPILASLEARTALHVVEGGGHSLEVSKRAGLDQPQIYADVLDRIVAWLRTLAEE